MRHYIDDELELFTGAHKRGHLPVLSAFNLRPPKKKISQEPDISTKDYVAGKVKWNQSRSVALDGNKKCNRIMKIDERTS